MAPQFDPFHLLPIASLNRRRFLLTAPNDREIIGKAAHEYLSAQALAEISGNIFALRVMREIDPSSRIRRLQSALTWENEFGRIANKLVEQYGRRLGYFLASLNSKNRLSPTYDPWEEAYLAFWANEVREIILGGGLVMGRMGEIIAAFAGDALAQFDKEMKVSVATHPYHLPLIGAARSFPAGITGRVVVTDFGHTSAKSALAAYGEDGALTALYPQPSRYIADVAGGDNIEGVAATMIKVIVELYQSGSQQGAMAPHIVCSLAAYLDEKQQPIKAERGAYTRLHLLAQPLDVSAWLAEEISRSVGTKVTVSFMRDTEAAAASFAGLRPSPSTAVVMLGTAMGVGFVPGVEGYRSIAGEFLIEDAS